MVCMDCVRPPAWFREHDPVYTGAVMANSNDVVIARYGSFYRGDDDYFMHCLIMKSGECCLLGQGLAPVTLRTFKAPSAELKKLTAAIATIPGEWPASSYTGYNFITDAKSPVATEIAVFGRQLGGAPGGYFVPPADSEVAKLVKSIANIDAAG